MIYATAFLCVIGLAIGQILFKFSAIAAIENGSYLSFRPAGALFLAMMLYGLTSLAWVWVLRKIELGRVYPLMALAFILVPLGSHLFFGERFSPQYFVGVALIMAGIFVAIRS
jgi:drug/metabolite transporter (DMT)-like permease